MPTFFQYEHKSKPVISRARFYNRMARTLLFSASIILVFLVLGVIGYHYTCGFDWVDSLLNASMILSGMGPTKEIPSVSGKIFASIYALVSGVVFISSIGILLAPVAHRLFHKLHLEESD